MIKKFKKILKKVFIFLLLNKGIFSFADTAYHVMDVYSKLPVPSFSQSVIHIENSDRNGTVSKATVIQYGKNSAETSALVLEIQDEDTKERMNILQIKKPKGGNDIWLYQPSMKNPKKHSFFDKNKFIWNTEFPLSSMSKRSIDDDRHIMLEEKEKFKINSISYDCWKIESRPINKSGIDYSYRISWIDKKTHLPLQIFFYKEKDDSKPFRTFLMEEIEHYSGNKGKDYDLNKCCTMKNEITGNSTRLTLKNFILEEEIPDSVFTTKWISFDKLKLDK